MNRELTILLKLAAPGGENAKVASDVSKQVSAVQAAIEASNATARQTAAAIASSATSASTSIGTMAASASRAASGMEKFSIAGKSAVQVAAELQAEVSRVKALFDAGLATDEDLDNVEARLREVAGALEEVAEGWREEAAQASAAARAAREVETSKRRLVSANRAYLEGARQVIESVTSLARGFVLLGLVDEKNIEAALRKLAAFEALAQSVRGMIGLVQGATKMWQAYQAAVLAAAAADGVKAVSGMGTVAGFAGRLAGGGLAAAAGATGAAGLAAGGGLFVEGAYNWATGRTATPMADSIAGAFTRFAGMLPEGSAGSLFAPFESSYYSRQRMMRTEAEGNARFQMSSGRDAFLANQLRNRFELDQIGIAGAARLAGAGLQGTEREIAATQAAIAERAKRGHVTSQIDETEDYGQQIAAIENKRQAIQDEIADQERLIELERKASTERIEAAQKNLTTAQRELEIANQRVQTTASSLLGFKGGDIQAVNEAARAARAGEDLNQKQIELLQRTQSPEFQAALARNTERIVRERGLGGIIDPLKQDVAKLETEVKAKAELVVKVEQELSRQEPIWMERIQTLIKDLYKDLGEATEKRQAAMWAEMQETLRKQKKAQDNPGTGTNYIR